MINCPLCTHVTEAFHRDRARKYFRCPQCDLVFVPKCYHLSPEEEKARYDFHQNDPGDEKYRAFLARLAEPVKAELAPGAHGLDYGCGPGPTLSVMFEEDGHPCAVYDLHYADHPEVLEKKYDFLTCSETMEHFYRPREEFELFLQVVRPGGWIGIMTQLREAARPFDQWHYKDDDTHVAFYSCTTFEFLADTYNLRLEFHSDSVILLQTKGF